MAGKARRTAAVLALLLLAAALFSLCLGASGISLWAGLWDALRGVDSAPARVLLHIRLPRTLAAMLAGAALSCAGVMIQGVLGNPLAGPNVIGVNAGAGLTTLLLAALAPSAVALLPAAAFAGALASERGMYESAKIAADFTCRCIRDTIAQPAHWYGVKFEPALRFLTKMLEAEGK